LRVVSKDEAKSNSTSSAQFGRSSSIAQVRDARFVVQLLHSFNTINAGGVQGSPSKPLAVKNVCRL
jgi:hypothetical protein